MSIAIVIGLQALGMENIAASQDLKPEDRIKELKESEKIIKKSLKAFETQDKELSASLASIAKLIDKNEKNEERLPAEKIKANLLRLRGQLTRVQQLKNQIQEEIQNSTRDLAKVQRELEILQKDRGTNRGSPATRPATQPSTKQEVSEVDPIPFLH